MSYSEILHDIILQNSMQFYPNYYEFSNKFYGNQNCYDTGWFERHPHEVLHEFSPTLRQTSTGLIIHVTFLALKILTLLHSEWPKLHRGLKCKKYPVTCTDQISKV